MRNVRNDRAAELRAAVARDGRKLYEIAPLMKMHLATLGQYLRGRRPIPEGMTERVLEALSAAPGGPAAA